MSNKPIARDARDFLLRSVAEHANDLTSFAAAHLDMSRQAVLKHIEALIEDNLIRSSGVTNGIHYELVKTTTANKMERSTTLEEHVVWCDQVEPQLKGLPANVLEVCNYGFTEMLNNAIDHSASTHIFVFTERSALAVTLTVGDDGIGIFRKIKEVFGLDDERAAILELSKGKLTTDSAKHTGEGIFFTSRMMQKFSITSNHLYFVHERDDGDDGDWLIENRSTETKGTFVAMTINTDCATTTKEVFDKYSGANYSFARTHVPLALAQYGESNLISRSQAKRVLARFDKFSEVILDFNGVKTIGQAFADEIFRVFKQSHPQIDIFPVRTTEEVKEMINRAISNPMGKTKLPQLDQSATSDNKVNP